MATIDNDIRAEWDVSSDLQYRIAASQEEREAAFRLVYHSYLRAGLGEENPYRVRITPYHLLPTTAVFVAMCQGHVAFTMSLIMDGDLGMPMESVYASEVEGLRQKGLRLGEVSCLADRRAEVCGFFPVFVHTCRLMVQYARHHGVDALLAAVHPKHSRFYRRYMAFQVFGKEKTYPTVRNNPAVALWLEFARIDREPPVCYDFMFGEPLSTDQLQPQPIMQDECEYYLPMIDRNFLCAPLGDPSEYNLTLGADDAIIYVV